MIGKYDARASTFLLTLNEWVVDVLYHGRLTRYTKTRAVLAGIYTDSFEWGRRGGLYHFSYFGAKSSFHITDLFR